MIRFWLIILICSSCYFAVDKTPIQLPKIDRQYYLNSIEALEEAIKEQPNYTPFIVLQLSYYEQLGWPPDASKAIDRASPYLSTDPHFFEQKIAFFRSNSLYSELIEALERYLIEGELPLGVQRDLTEALIYTHDTIQARLMLKRLENKREESLSNFIFESYRVLGDTLSLIAYYEQHTSDFELEDIVDMILPLYVGAAQWAGALALQDLYPTMVHHSKAIVPLAKSYFEIDSVKIAEQLLVNDTSWDASQLLMHIYLSQYRYVSATRLTDRMIRQYPERISLLKRRAWLANERGYYAEATYFYEKVLEIDSTHEEARQEIDQIKQKIAYLRRQKKQNQILPILGLDSLKKDISQ